MKKYKFLLFSLLLVAFLTLSCDNGILEPDFPEDSQANSLGIFDIDTISATGRELFVKWNLSENAVRYDVIVNDTINLPNNLNTTCLLTKLEPNTNYKVSVRAYDKNNFTKTVSKWAMTTFDSSIEISVLPFGKYDYQTINVTHCKVTKDNNYIILADVFIFNKAYKLVLKTDRNFNIIWKRNFEGGRFDYMNNFSGQDIKECNDGGFLIISRKFNFKVTKDGNLTYQNKYPIVNNEPWIENGVETADGNFLYVGSKYWKLNTNSENVWLKSNNYQKITDVIQNDSGNYFIYGTKKLSTITSGESNNIMLVELDESGNQLREIVYPFSEACSSMDLISSKDNGYYLLSHSTFTYYALMSELCVTKTNNKGEELWTKHTYPELEKAVTVVAARVLQNNTLLCLCSDSYSYYSIIEISPDGKILRTFNTGSMYAPVFVDKDENGVYTILTQGGYIYKQIE